MTGFIEIVEQYKRDYPANFEVLLSFDTCKIRFTSNDKQLVDFLEDYFSEFLADFSVADIEVTGLETPEFHYKFDYTVKQPDPGKSKIKEEWIDLENGRIVRKVLTGIVCLFGGEHNLVVGPCRKNDSQVVNFIIHRYIEWLLRQDGLLLHAAGVKLLNRGTALAGFSGMGKSTLALHMMNLGTSFVSNDRAIARQQDDRFLLNGVPKMPRINPGTIVHNSVLRTILKEDEIEYYQQMPKEQLWDLEDKHDALIHKLYGSGKFELSAEMHGLVVLNWNHEDAAISLDEVDIRSRQDLLPAFTKSTGLFNDPRAEGNNIDVGDQAYIDFFSRCPVFEITGKRDFKKAAKLCLEIIR
jgi:HprK-related kinase B